MSEYVGIPFKAKGRGLDGADCWGLTALFLWREFKIKLPSYSGEYDEPITENLIQISELIDHYSKQYDKVDEPRRGDICLFRVFGNNTHVAVYLGNKNILNTEEGKLSTIERIDSNKWNKRLAGFFRHQCLA